MQSRRLEGRARSGGRDGDIRSDQGGCELVCWSPLGYIHYIYWDIAGGGRSREAPISLPLPGCITSTGESKYSLHQENLPIMMGAGHYCDQLSHRSGKWDVINVAVNNNIRIYCGNLPHQLKSDLTRPLGSHYRHTKPPQPGTVPTLPVPISLNSTNALIVKQRTKRISEVSYRLFARHFCIFYLYLFSYQYL